MCIEKRHHHMSRPTLCSYSTLSQAQPQTIGFKPPPPPLGCQVNMWRYHGLLFMVSIALVDARKTSLTGVQNSNKKNRLAATWLGHQNSQKNRLAATRLVDDAPHRRWVKPPPPLEKKARSAPVYSLLLYMELFIYWISINLTVILTVMKANNAC